MNRMTTLRKDGRWAIANNDGATPLQQMEKLPLAINRLAEYENTGLSVEDILKAKDLIAAASEGRAVILPCKLGDTVWRICPMKPGKGRGFVMSAVVSAIHIGEIKGKQRTPPHDYIVLRHDGNFCAHVKLSDIGKKVFLTKEEAESALDEIVRSDNK